MAPERILYLTNGPRGVHCLRALLAAGEPVAGVLGHAGSESSEAAAIARDAGLPYLAPESPNSDAVLEEVRKLDCSLAIMSGYARILRGRFIASFPEGVINLHGGPLPGYRGGSPLNWQILRGETSIGISILFTETGIDTGPLLAEDRFDLGPDETIDSVVARSLPAFEKLLLSVLQGLRDGTLRPRPQRESGARYFAKRLPRDGWIDWRTMSAKQVHDLVRALAGSYPGAFTQWKGRKLVLETTRLLDETIIGPPRPRPRPPQRRRRGRLRRPRAPRHPRPRRHRRRPPRRRRPPPAQRDPRPCRACRSVARLRREVRAIRAHGNSSRVRAVGLPDLPLLG